MVKRRAVVVLVQRKRERLCTVAPFSTSPPQPVMPYHAKLSFDPELPHPYSGEYKWLKGDMVYTVSWDRLDRPHIKDRATGKRTYVNRHLSATDFQQVQTCVRAALCL